MCNLNAYSFVTFKATGNSSLTAPLTSENYVETWIVSPDSGQTLACRGLRRGGAVPCQS